MANEEDHALVTDGEALTEFALMANIENKSQRPSPTVVSTSAEGQNKDSSTSEDVASPNLPKPFVKFVKPKDTNLKASQKNRKHLRNHKSNMLNNRHSNKRPKGNQRNWNNLKSYQLDAEFVLHKKPCFNYGDFSHLPNDCRRRVQRETTRSQNHPYQSPSHRSTGHRPNGAPMRPPLRSSGPRPHGGSMRPSLRPTGHRLHGPSMNPRRPTMNGARPYKSFFIQAPSYETRPFLKSSAVKTPYRAPWVPTVNRLHVTKPLLSFHIPLLSIRFPYTVKVEDFIPMGSKEETERLKRKGLNLEKEQVKKQKSSEEAPEIKTSNEEFTKEKIKEMMQLVPLKDVYVQALQVKHPIIDWKVHTEGRI
nr:hypothetical protein [Tanacetum cinerariifolium]